MFTLIFQLVAFIIFLAPFILAYCIVKMTDKDNRSEAEKELDRVAMKAYATNLKAKDNNDVRHVRLHRDLMNSCK